MRESKLIKALEAITEPLFFGMNKRAEAIESKDAVYTRRGRKPLDSQGNPVPSYMVW